MTKKIIFFITTLACCATWATPILQMNKAFNALVELVPYLTDRDRFIENKNGPVIEQKISDLQLAFKMAKHEPLLREDLFAPSYALINENLAESMKAFKAGNKDYAHWRIQEITSLCMDCHTRLPSKHASSFQNGELIIDKTKFDNPYNLGIAQLIVRRYVDAKESFFRSIDDKFIKKDFKNIILPFKQILLIDSKILKNPENLKLFINSYLTKKDLPEEVRVSITEWNKRLKFWIGNKTLTEGLKNDKDVEKFIKDNLEPLKRKVSYLDEYDVDLLIASGLLSNFLFENPGSAKAAEISYWLGWTEKYLKRDNFFGPGDLFLKQCIKRYHKDPIAKKCFEEYKESLEFEFSGSAGTNIPADIQEELNELKNLIKSHEK